MKIGDRVISFDGKIHILIDIEKQFIPNAKDKKLDKTIIYPTVADENGKQTKIYGYDKSAMRTERDLELELEQAAYWFKIATEKLESFKTTELGQVVKHFGLISE